MILWTGGKVKGDNPVLEMFTTGAEYPGLDGIMGNNMIPLIQLPRTFYFSQLAFNSSYKNTSKTMVLSRLDALTVSEKCQRCSRSHGGGGAARARTAALPRPQDSHPAGVSGSGGGGRGDGESFARRHYLPAGQFERGAPGAAGALRVSVADGDRAESAAAARDSVRAAIAGRRAPA